jgi:hypothetical protein
MANHRPKPERALMKQMDDVTLGRHYLEMTRLASDYARKARHYQGIADSAQKEIKRRRQERR